MPTTFAPLPATSCLLIIDVQERFTGVIPAIAAGGPVAKKCRILLEAARLLAIPAVISEQVPDKLGPTIAELVAVQETFATLADELEEHMVKEERILFPACVALEEGAAAGFPFGSVENPIRVMLDDHDEVAAGLARLDHIRAR